MDEGSFDCIVVLAYSFDDSWELPQHLKDRLKIVAELAQKVEDIPIILCGKRSIHWDWKGIEPPVIESELMKDELIGHGVDADRIITEARSQDTPSNIYYLKQVLRNENLHSPVVYCASHHEERVGFLLQKILGSDYHCSVVATHSPGSDNATFMAHEHTVLEEQRTWMHDMKNGDDGWLDGKFFSDEYYTRQIDGSRRESDRKATIYLANQ